MRGVRHFGDAQKIIKADGVTTVDWFGAPRAHPALTIARDAAATIARLAGQLDLELDDDVVAVRSPYRAKSGPGR